MWDMLNKKRSLIKTIISVTIDVGDDFDDRVVYVNRGFVFVVKDKSTIYMIGRMDAVWQCELTGICHEMSAKL